MSGHTNPAFDGLTLWPAAAVDKYRQAGLWGEQNLAQWLSHVLQTHPQPVALSGPGFAGTSWQEWSGQALCQTASNMAAGFQAIGLKPGDRVVLQLDNSCAFVITLFAVLLVGVIPVMALPGHRFREIAHFIRLTDARAWLASAGEAGMDFNELGSQLRTALPGLEHVFIDTDKNTPHRSLSSLLSPANPQLPLPGNAVDAAGTALLLCSGGTTGLPKLIPRTHRDYLYNATASAQAAGLGPTDCYLVALPAAHNFPLACPGLLGAFQVGARVTMCPSPSPDIAFPYLARSGATVTALIPPLVRVWLEYAANLGTAPANLRLLQVGGAKLDSATARRIRPELGCALQQVFGMAEGLLNYTHLSDPDMLVYNTQGCPLSAFDEIRIVDAQGNDVPAGKSGELWTRGPYTLRGYYKAADANQGAFSPDGYYRSGDIVRQLSSGHLIVEGRIREVIRRGAETVAVEALEAMLAQLDGIKDVAVVGLPCERLGEQVCAVFVLTDTAAPPMLAAVRQYLSELGTARFMLPDRLEFVAEIPCTAVGKIARQQLSNSIQQSRHNVTFQGTANL